MAAEKRLEQSTLSFVVNSASTSSSSRPPEDNSVSMVLGRHEDRPTNMDQEAAHEEPTSLLEVAIGRTRVLTEGEKYELLTTSQFTPPVSSQGGVASHPIHPPCISACCCSCYCATCSLFLFFLFCSFYLGEP